MKVRDAIRRLQKEGWYLDHTTGSHRQFAHPTKKGLVTVPGKPSDDLAPGTENSIKKGVRLEMSRYAIVFEPPIRPGGNWGAYVPDLPGCVSTGDTLDDCRAMIREAIEVHIAGLKRHGYEIPAPCSRVETLDVAA